MTADPSGALALALDELLCSLTPADADALGAWVPVGLRDQLDAAAEQSHAVLGLLGGSVESGDAVDLSPPADAPGWLRLGALAALAGWLSGHGSTCMHSPRPGRPQPLAAAAWRPGLVVCTDCTHLLGAPNNQAAHICDGCGRNCPRDDRDGIWSGAIVVGVLTYCFGACPGCLPVADPTTESAPR